jgi:hypothetical protein
MMTRKASIVLGALAGIALVIALIATASKEPSANKTETVAKPATPSMPRRAKPPEFRLLQRNLDEVVAIVVSPKTTDEQIKDLLWYLHETVQSQQFKKLGLNPTTRDTGVPNYEAGIIDIYRNSRCARENWMNAGPDCGYGEHQVAEYGWGGSGGPSADDAAIVNSDGSRTPIFRFNEPEPNPQ